ncbi:MAG: hypothetical protein QXR30_02950 [Candidatus Woesearchaeota archaeon]
MSLDFNIEKYYEHLLEEVRDSLVSLGWDKQFVDEHLQELNKYNRYSLSEETDLELRRYKNLIHKIYLGMPYRLKEYFLERSEYVSLDVNHVLELFDETYDKLIEFRNKKRNSELKEYVDQESKFLTELVHYGLGIENIESIFEIIYSDEDHLDENTIYEKNQAAISYIKDFYFPELILKKDD